jgi:RHS repeat-associated protein
VAEQYFYFPFGQTLQSAGTTNPFQFTGRENDGTGLMYYRARYYVPDWGRFISEDPIGFAGGINRYAYVNNAPQNSTDPSGLLTLPSDPTGLGPDWSKDPNHAPNKPDKVQRWYHKNGQDGLEWHKGDPNAPAGKWERVDHWHILRPGNKPGRWVTEDAHLRPGTDVRDPIATSLWEPGVKDTTGLLLLIPPIAKGIELLWEIPAAIKAVADLCKIAVPALAH